jgi:hypothetical protein
LIAVDVVAVVAVVITPDSSRFTPPYSADAASSIVPALLIARIIIRWLPYAVVRPKLSVDAIVKLAGVPDTVVTVPLVNVVERKSSDSAEAETVIALVAIDAEIGCRAEELTVLATASVPVTAGSVSV